METIDVGKSYYHRLANRDETQGDGQHTAIEFRKKYLSSFDSPEAWKSNEPTIILDFKNVEKIGPSFANEVFAFFAKYAKPDEILNKISVVNATKVQMLIIKEELESGYQKK
jgi:hypothetical protein